MSDLGSNDRIDVEASGDETRAVLVAYALGTATADEADEARRLLAQSPELRRELASYRRLGAAMATAVPPLAPPAGGLDRLLEAARSDAVTVTAPAVARAARPGMSELLLAPRWRLSPALAAAVLAVFLGIILLQARQLDTMQQTYVQAISAAERQTVAMELMRAPDVGWVQMRNPVVSDPMVGPSAWLIYSPGEQSGVILAHDFPALGQDQAYQVWAVEDGEPRSLGLFQVDPAGAGAFTFQLPDVVTRYERFGITPEPATGSPGPTAPPVVRIEAPDFVSRLT